MRTNSICQITISGSVNSVISSSTSNRDRIKLSKNSFFKLTGDSRGVSIRSVAGSIWVTVENDSRDYVLKQGDEFVVNKKGSVIVEALTNAAVAIRQI